MELEINEGVAWFTAVVGLFAAIIVLIVTLGGYYRAVDAAAIAKGLCESTVQGSGAIVWTTCPAK